MKDLNSMIKEYHELVVDLKKLMCDLKREHDLTIITNRINLHDNPDVHIFRGIEKVADALSTPLAFEDRYNDDFPMEKLFVIDDVRYFELCEEEGEDE